ncbi:hypothetical protein BC937DRAFT_88322 [Endogone sp. FLAS-F59071]|nr:hypothetical protein BC937DRAFT_88322 [Endogone sp. FLAS-F59071]|eukprot:RUS18801.1 hypothetical protein BC937DRAFT_88322 [Endogone sp. FLAS-F59071]
MNPIQDLYSRLRQFEKSSEWSKANVQQFKNKLINCGIYKDLEDAHTAAFQIQVAIVYKSHSKWEFEHYINTLDDNFQEYIRAARPLPLAGCLDDSTGLKAYVPGKGSEANAKQQQFLDAQQKLHNSLNAHLPFIDDSASLDNHYHSTNSITGEISGIDNDQIFISQPAQGGWPIDTTLEVNMPIQSNEQAIIINGNKLWATADGDSCVVAVDGTWYGCTQILNGNKFFALPGDETYVHGVDNNWYRSIVDSGGIKLYRLNQC